MGKTDILLPSYYRDFKCKCKECRCVCCYGWRINITEREFFALSNAKCSHALHKVIKDAFITGDSESSDCYASMSELKSGYCVFLDSDGMCSLQKECGEDILPSVCRLYPRSVFMGKTPELSFSASCEKTVELLMSLKEPLSFVKIERDYPGVLPSSPENADDALILRAECEEIIKDRRIPLHERCFEMGKLLCRNNNTDKFDYPDYLKTSLVLIKALEKNSVNIKKYAAPALSFVGDDLDKYLIAEKKVMHLLPELENYYEALLLNHMFYIHFPYNEMYIDRVGDYDEIYASYILGRYITVCYVAQNADNPSDAETAFSDSASGVFRYIEHSSFPDNARIIMDSLRLSKQNRR